MPSVAKTPKNNLANVVFYLTLGMLFTHELDAMANREWRVLPLTSGLADDLGRQVFLLLHIPLFAVLIALVASPNTVLKNRARWWICAFAVFHGPLHMLFSSHSDYQFATAISHLLIYGGAVSGALYLACEWLSRPEANPRAAGP